MPSGRNAERILSGEYDYSCTPEQTLAVANSVAGCEATIIKGLGHFPMSEDPTEFLQYLLPVLEKIGAMRSTAIGAVERIELPPSVKTAALPLIWHDRGKG
jgi:hypothetical protein